MSKIDIKSMTKEELSYSLAEINLPKFRANQIFSWLHQKGVSYFSDMTNLSKDLRQILEERYVINSCEIERKRVSKEDGTIKYLFKLFDGEYIESVLMKYKYGYSLCVSTQVGCRMGCKFCASTLGGVIRDLFASEILSQIHTVQNDENIRVSHVVLMGMGEPFDNFENVKKFLFLANCEEGLNLSMRNISLSTCGIIPKIYELMELDLQLTLSVSLHAPNDKIRSEIMPINNKYCVSELIKACRAYTKKTSRRISFEYSMISGVNDSDDCARELSNLLKGMLCHVNLIPVNNVRENNFVRSDDNRLNKFVSILKNNSINVTVRRTLGKDIEASCGQLRKKHIDTLGGD